MPLHEWTDGMGWEGMHHLWLTELLRWVKPRLPAGYRAYIGSPPTIAIGAPTEKPDVAVRDWHTPQPQPQTTLTAAQPKVNGQLPAPDDELAVPSLEYTPALHVERRGRLISAVELISPRNKDRPVARATYLARYAGYLLEGVHLLLVDVHRRPLSFSFADEIARELEVTQPPLPAPLAVSYRVGEPAAKGGRLLAFWRRALTVGDPLPELPVAPVSRDRCLRRFGDDILPCRQRRVSGVEKQLMPICSLNRFSLHTDAWHCERPSLHFLCYPQDETFPDRLVRWYPHADLHQPQRQS